MAPISAFILLTWLSVDLALGHPLSERAAAPAKSGNITATFDDIPSGPYYAANQLGSYVSSTFVPNNPPAVPIPYKQLAWNNFLVLNNSTVPNHSGGYYEYAGAQLQATSGANYAMGFRNKTNPTGTGHNFTVSYPGSNVTAFSLQSLSYGCFIDDDGQYLYDGYYFRDKITAVDCVLRFTAYKGKTLVGTKQVDYLHGCDQRVPQCNRNEAPMQTVLFGKFARDFHNVTEVAVAVESYTIRGKTSFGYYLTGDIEIIVGIDTVKYTVQY